MTATSVKLGDVLEIYRGGSPRPIENFITEDSDGLNWIKIGDVGVGEKYIEKTKEKIKKEGLSKTRQVYAGDFLLSNSMSFGRPYITKIDGCIHDGWLTLRDSKNLFDKDFLYHLLSSQSVKAQFAKFASGAVVKNLNIDAVSKVTISIPPLAEQKRIAALLDTADNIMRLREQAIAKLDELVLSKFSEIEVNVKEHIELEKILVKPKVESKLTSEKVWSLSLDQIESQTGKLIDKVFVDKNDLGTSTFFFKPPVVLYSKLRPYLNKVYIPDSEGYATTELIPLYCNKDLVLPEYLALMLMSKKFVEYATVNSGGAKMPRMMMDKFWNYPVPLANMSVQQNIAKIYNQIKSAKKVMELDLQKLHNLNSSLQHQTFAVN